MNDEMIEAKLRSLELQLTALYKMFEQHAAIGSPEHNWVG